MRVVAGAGGIDLRRGVDGQAFEQAAGFLRVPGSRNPLDNTTIHPESYGATKELLELSGLNLRMKDLPNSLRRWLASAGMSLEEQGGKWTDVAALLSIGEPTLHEIVDALLRPGRDPRDDLPPVVLRRDVLSIDDLREGMILKGTVRNVVDFGAFVDIGLPDSGLIHISRLADRFVKDPHEIVSVGDILNVWVVEVDRQRRRVSLTAIKPGTERPPQERKERAPPTSRPEGRSEGRPEGRGEGRSGRAPQGRRPEGRQPYGQRGGGGGGGRPRVTEVRPSKPKPVTPITDAMAQGKEPSRVE